MINYCFLEDKYVLRVRNFSIFIIIYYIYYIHIVLLFYIQYFSEAG